MSSSVYFPAPRHTFTSLQPWRVSGDHDLLSIPCPSCFSTSKRHLPSRLVKSDDSPFRHIPTETYFAMLDHMSFAERAAFLKVNKKFFHVTDAYLKTYLCLRGPKALKEFLNSIRKDNTALPVSSRLGVERVVQEIQTLVLDFSIYEVTKVNSWFLVNTDSVLQSVLRVFKYRALLHLTINMRDVGKEEPICINLVDIYNLSPTHSLHRLTLVSPCRGEGIELSVVNSGDDYLPQVDSLWIAYDQVELSLFKLTGHLRIFGASVDIILENFDDFSDLKSLQIAEPDCWNLGNAPLLGLPPKMENFSCYGLKRLSLNLMSRWAVGQHLVEFHLRDMDSERLKLGPIYSLLGEVLAQNQNTLKRFGLNIRFQKGHEAGWKNAFVDFSKCSKIVATSMDVDLFAILHDTFPIHLETLVLDFRCREVINFDSLTPLRRFLRGRPSVEVVRLRSETDLKGLARFQSLAWACRKDADVQCSRMMTEEEIGDAHPVQREWDGPRTRLSLSEIVGNDVPILTFDVESFSECRRKGKASIK